MKWFYELPSARQKELMVEWERVSDLIIGALGGRSRENEEIATEAANRAIFRIQHPFV